jgi:ATP-dependent RNA helicase RhlE
MMHDPVKVEVAPQGRTADRITQTLYYVPMAQKRQLLTLLLEDVAMNRVIVFTRTKHGANRVAQHLGKSKIDAEAIHGNKSQNARQRALDLFRKGKVRVLVATDIAARGIDIDDISHVVNFELPNEPESYVHRIGRTARAGGEGIAISFCDATERGYLRDIERLIGNKIEVQAHSLPEPTPEQIQESKAQAPRQNRGHKHGAGKGARGGNGVPFSQDGLKKRGGARPHWHKSRTAQKPGQAAKAQGAGGRSGPHH